MVAKKSVEKRPWILLVDDDPSWIRLMKVLVGNEMMLCCSDSRKVLDPLKTEQFDCVITDTNMPHLSGIELLKKIRGQRQFSDLPVIVLFSGLYGSELTKQDVIQAGATLVIEKDEFVVHLPTLLKNLKSLRTSHKSE